MSQKMTSSIPSANNLKVNSIEYSDGTIGYSEKEKLFDTRFRKKMRVDNDASFRKDVAISGNLTVAGSISSPYAGDLVTSYTDNQTGWGLPEWEFAGVTYDKNLDSLIVKIYNIQINYATISYVDSKIQNSSAKYLIAREPESYPLFNDPAYNYVYPITTLTSNSALIFRDDVSGFMDLKIQKANLAVGKFLQCLDNEGTVGWGDSGGTISIPTTITTSLGSTNSIPSFQIIDGSRSFQFYPNVINNLLNKALMNNSSFLAMENLGGETCAVGALSYGSEAISFKKSTSSTEQNGYTTISGGTDSISNQFIKLGTDGIVISPKVNRGVTINLPYVEKNLPVSFIKPFNILGNNQGSNEYPTMTITKEDSSGLLKNTFAFNPRVNDGNFSPMASSQNLLLTFSDTSLFDANGSSSVYPTTFSTMILSPWSDYCEGVQIRNSLLSSELVNGISGFTRICGSAQFFRDNVTGYRSPRVYVETNREGITIRNNVETSSRPATKTVNYGPFQVLNRVGPTLNDTDSTIVPSSFQVGTLSSLCPSNLNGPVTISGDLLYNHYSKAYGSVLTCVNATTGEARWQPVVNSIITDLTVQNLTVNDSFTFPNLIDQTTYTPASSVTMLNTLQGLSNFNISQSGSVDSTPPVNTDIYWETVASNFASINIQNPKQNHLYQFTVPVRYNFDWQYAGNKQLNSEYCEFYCVLDYYTVYVLNNQTFNVIEEWTVNVKEYNKSRGIVLPSSEIYHHRTLSPYTCNNAATTWKFKQPLDVLRIKWAPPYAETGTFTLKIKFGGKWKGFGEHCRLILMSTEVNFPLISSNPLQKEVIPFNDPSSNILQYNEGLYNSGAMPYEVASFQILTDRFSKNSFLNSQGSKSLRIGTASIENIQLAKEFFQPNGCIYSCGFASRRGLPLTTGTYDSKDVNSFWSFSNWGSLVNFWWTGTTYQLWVDYTMVHEITPNFSDYRLKENIEPCDSVLEQIAKLQVIKYSFKPHEIIQPTHSHVGILAHELQDILPQFKHLVSGEKDETDASGSPKYQTVGDEIKFILLKAIQELKQENDLLKLQITELYDITRQLTAKLG